MTAPPPTDDGLNQAIQRTHRSVLILLALCAAVAWVSTAADASETTPRAYAWAATALGGIAILTRPFRSMRIERPRLVAARIVISLVAAAGVGLVGVAAAVAGSPRTTALAYVAAGAIFALRPPARIRLPAPGVRVINWRRTRSYFPVTRELAYFNHAGVAPISTRALEAIERFTAEATRYGAFRYASAYDQEIERVRDRAAELLSAQREEIAFVKNTTEGIGIVAAGIDWQRGDRVVSCDLEYPSNVYPWWHLKSRGVETVMLAGVDGTLPLASLEAALRDPRVRLVSLSSVQFGTGARTDLAAVGRLCREHGVLFCVDAIQSLGCFPIDVEACGIDFLSADGHKWLLSVEGCGVFFCARRSLDLLTPRVVGWRSVADNHDFDRYHMDLQPSAGRFEEGTPNVPGIFALGAAIDLLLEIGVPLIGARVLELTDQLVQGLAERGAEVLSPRADGAASGIVSFQLPREAPADTARRLRAEGVFVIERRGGVRASPHFYNDTDDLDRLLRAL